MARWLPGKDFGLSLEIDQPSVRSQPRFQHQAWILGISWTGRWTGNFPSRLVRLNTCGQGGSGWVGLGGDNEAKAPLGPIVHCAHHCDRESERRMWQDHHCHPVGR